MIKPILEQDEKNKQSAVKNRRLFNRYSKQKGYLSVAFIYCTIS